VLVDFLPGFEPDLRRLLAMEDELSALLKHPVDLGEWQSVEADPNYLRREHILQSARVVYTAAN
jgi:hypothetical protein